METLQQMLMPVLAAFVFLILIAKIASVATDARADADADHPQSSHNIRGNDLGTALQKELKSLKTEKSSIRTKSKKKVRFAVDHQEFVVDHQEFVVNNVNKTVSGPSETKSIIFKKNCSETEDDHGKEEGGIELVGEMVNCDENVGKCDENRMCMKLLCDDGIDEAEKEKEGLISEEDDSSDEDWEGVERSDLEKVFALAVDYCKVDDNLLSLESDVQMQLYGLYKVATEGPCYEAQPMALKVSARAKWNSWQKLGNMNPDVAMEKYIALLSELVPGWSQGIHSVDKH